MPAPNLSAEPAGRVVLRAPSDIEPLLDALLAREGGYVDHPDDVGGPTAFGVTRAVARAAGYAGDMRALSREQAKAIYLERYWRAPRLDAVAAISGAVAAEMFDTGVNMGPETAVRLLQRALNVFNRGGVDYADVAEDGRLGPATAEALRGLLRVRGGDGEAVLLTALNCLQGARYIDLAEARAANESFVYGWLKQRVVLTARRT